MTLWPTLALLAAAGALPAAACAQAVPGTLAFSEIEIGLVALRFDRDDVLSVETFPLDGLYALELRLSPDMAPGIAALTNGKIGYEVTLRVCGLTAIEARLQHELVEPVVLFTSGAVSEIAAAADLLHNPPCADL